MSGVRGKAYTNVHTMDEVRRALAALNQLIQSGLQTAEVELSHVSQDAMVHKNSIDSGVLSIPSGHEYIISEMEVADGAEISLEGGLVLV